MRYRIEAESREGIRYQLWGFKVVHYGRADRAWSETTTLYLMVERVVDSQPPQECGRGILRVSPRSLVRLLASMNLTNVPRRLDREHYRYRFASHFLRSLLPFYGGVLDEGARFPQPPPAPRRLPEPGGVKADDVRWCDPGGTWHDRAVPDACSG